MLTSAPLWHRGKACSPQRPRPGIAEQGNIALRQPGLLQSALCGHPHSRICLSWEESAVHTDRPLPAAFARPATPPANIQWRSHELTLGVALWPPCALREITATPAGRPRCHIPTQGRTVAVKARPEQFALDETARWRGGAVSRRPPGAFDCGQSAKGAIRCRWSQGRGTRGTAQERRQSRQAGVLQLPQPAKVQGWASDPSRRHRAPADCT